MLRFIETIKIANGLPQNLNFHQKRLEYTISTFYPNIEPINLFNISIPDNIDRNKIYKCRVIYADKIYDIQFNEYQKKEIQTLKLIFDNYIDYSFKFEDRSRLINLYNLREDCDDILIVKNNLVTDTSYCNIAFYNKGKWITPKNPLLKGTKREYLLLINSVIEDNIFFDQIKFYDKISLFNSMIDLEEIVFPTKNIK